MRRAASLLVGGLVLGTLGCGDAGSGAGIPRAGVGIGVGDEPNRIGTEAPGSWTEMPSSFNESEFCGTEEVISLSDLLLNFSLPICRFEESCSDSVTAQPSEGTQAPNSRALGMQVQGQLEQIPSFCFELAQSYLPERAQWSQCESIEAIGKVAQTVPGCQQLIMLPAGFCRPRVSRCVSEFLEGGCAFFKAEIYPKSCPDLWSDDESQPVDEPQPGDPVRPGF